jgi:integrase
MASVLTQSSVGKLTTSTRLLLADAGCRGLYVDVRPHATTYRFRYTDRERKQRAETIGDAKLLKLSEAREIARDMARRLVLGEDLKVRLGETTEPKPQLMTFRSFVEERYLPQARMTRRSMASELSALKNSILPIIGDRPLVQISKGEVMTLIHGLIAKGQAAATINRTLAHIRSIFNRAIEWEIDGIEKNPAKGVKPVPDRKRHERYLSPDEAQRLLEAVSASSNRMLPLIIAFLLLTGCRKREALDARWENIDLERGVLTIPLSKSGKPRYVPLSSAARNVLVQTRREVVKLMGDASATNGWVFPNPNTGRPFIKIQTGWERARRVAGLEGLRIHDLRHSFASALVNRGMTLYDVKEALGHSSMVTTQRYAHLAPQRLMQAVTAAQDHYQLPMLVG